MTTQLVSHSPANNPAALDAARDLAEGVVGSDQRISALARAGRVDELVPAECAEELDTAPEAVISSDGHGYITNGELLAWLANVTSGRYDDMRRLMLDCDARRLLQKDLGQLRALMDETKVNHDEAALLEAARSLRDTYAGTELAPEVEKLLGPMIDELEARRDVAERAEAEHAEYLATLSSTDPNPEDVLMGPDLPTPPPPLDERTLDAWGSNIQSEIDALAKEDQLQLINIQEIHGQINQQTQLASNLLAATARALDNTVANIRG